MSITAALRDYLERFPGLAGGVMHVDWLQAEARTYTIDSVPAEPILKTYMDGSSRRQYLFQVASREFFAPDVENQARNMAWFEEFQDWVETQNLFRKFPVLGDRKKCQRIEIVSTAYPFSVSEDGYARYQVQMRLIYFQEGIL